LRVTLHDVESRRNGWLITLKAEIEPSQLNQESLQKMEDWEVTFQDNLIYLQGYFDLSEPWEDEPLEEIQKAAIMEVEWKLNRILK
jgi:hypothetical protein